MSIPELIEQAREAFADHPQLRVDPHGKVYAVANIKRGDSIYMSMEQHRLWTELWRRV